MKLCITILKYTSIEKDRLGDWSPEKDCCYWLTFRQPVRKPSSESSGSVSQLKIQKQKFGFIKRVDEGWITTVKDLESWRFER